MYLFISYYYTLHLTMRNAQDFKVSQYETMITSVNKKKCVSKIKKNEIKSEERINKQQN